MRADAKSARGSNTPPLHPALAHDYPPLARQKSPSDLVPTLLHCIAGTLTLNKLSVDASTVLCLGGHSVDEVLKLSALSSQIDSEEAIDVVLVESYHGASSILPLL